MAENGFDRREMIGAAALALGVVGVPLAALRSMRVPEGDVPPTDRQLAVVKEVAQILIPRTDTPGGADVGADDFLVLALAHGLDGSRTPGGGAAIQGATAYYRCPDGSLDHLAWLEDELDLRAGDFLAAPLARRQAALDAIDRAAFADHRASGPWTTVKGLLLTGYYTSQAGGSWELRYELVPGRFDPDLPLTAKDRAWSSDWTAVEFG